MANPSMDFVYANGTYGPYYAGGNGPYYNTAGHAPPYMGMPFFLPPSHFSPYAYNEAPPVSRVPKPQSSSTKEVKPLAASGDISADAFASPSAYLPILVPRAYVEELVARAATPSNGVATIGTSLPQPLPAAAPEAPESRTMPPPPPTPPSTARAVYPEQDMHAGRYATSKTIIIMKASYKADRTELIDHVKPHAMSDADWTAAVVAYWQLKLVNLQNGTGQAELKRACPPRHRGGARHKNGDTLVFEVASHENALLVWDNVSPIGKHAGMSRIRWYNPMHKQ